MSNEKHVGQPNKATTDKMPPVAVGQTVWAFDHNHGRRGATGSYIYASHWHRTTVAKVGRVILTLRNGRQYRWEHGRFQCGDPGAGRIAFDRADVETDVWVNANRSTLVQLVQNANVDELRRVAAALNYAAEEPQLED